MHPMEGAVRGGEVLALVQRSVRRRDYELRRGDREVGWLRFPSGRRSTGQADGDQTGLLALTASRGGVEVRSRKAGGTTVATVERAGRGIRLIRTAHGSARPTRTGRDAALLDRRFLALQELQAEIDGSAVVGGVVAAGAG